MKNRLTFTIDPAITKRARKLARARNTSVSGLVEELLRSAPFPGGEKQGSFAERWAGKFSVADTSPGNQRMALLKARHGLPSR
jgi:hypothetical protein